MNNIHSSYPIFSCEKFLKFSLLNYAFKRFWWFCLGLRRCSVIHHVVTPWRMVWWWPKLEPVNMGMERIMGLGSHISMDTCNLYWCIFFWNLLPYWGNAPYFTLYFNLSILAVLIHLLVTKNQFFVVLLMSRVLSCYWSVRLLLCYQ